MSQLKREDWLEHGLNALVEKGADTLTIDRLCRELGVTKGSFYHHFKNRNAYLRAVLDHWEDQYTSRFIAVSQEGLTAEEQIARLNMLVVENFGSYEVRIRAWAQTDPLAREYQERVDQRRLDYLRTLYRHWLDDTQAQAMAHLVYTALIGSGSLIPPLTPTDYQTMMGLFPHLIKGLTQDDPKT